MQKNIRIVRLCPIQGMPELARVKKIHASLGRQQWTLVPALSPTD